MDDSAPQVVTPQVTTSSRKQPRKKTASFIRTMDKLVFGSAVTLFCLWLLGHGVLWLIGGSAGGASSLASFGQGSSVDRTAVAHLADSDSEPTATQSESHSSDEEEEEHEHDHDSDASAETVEHSSANQFNPSAPQPTETSFRPTYNPAAGESSSEDESTGFSSPTATLKGEESIAATDTGLNPSELDLSINNLKLPTETLGNPADMESDVDPNDFASGNNTKRELDETKLEFGADAGPIEKLKIPDVSSPTEVDPDRDRDELTAVPAIEVLEKPRTYPMRVWTSAKGSKANLALVKVEGDKIVVVDESGKQFGLVFARFSEEDQAYVLDAIKN